MRNPKFNISTLIVSVFAIAALSSCKKDGNPNNLPAVSTSAYEGKIDGYTSSDEIYSSNLVAYWSFEGTKNETKSNKAPTSSANDGLVAGGVKGQALSLNAGYVYYASQFDAFKTEALKSFTVSEWVQIANNGSKRTMIFQLARPGIFNGSLNFILETNANPASDLKNLIIHPTFTTIGGGTQDNLNAPWLTTFKSPEIGSAKWTHLLITYDSKTGIFNIWADGVKVGDYSNRGVGNNLFKSYEPGEVIIGGNYNVIPGKAVNTNTDYAAMTGKIDEIRVYNITMPDAHIKALYNLGKAGK